MRWLVCIALLLAFVGACDRRDVTNTPDAAARVLYDDDQIRELVGLTARLSLGMKKADVVALLGPPTHDHVIASKESENGMPRRVYGSSVAYIGRDGRTLRRVPSAEDRIMTGVPTLAFMFDTGGVLVSISANIEGATQRGGVAPPGAGDRDS